jgi:uncharacterized protein (TIGR02646 family)
MNRMARGEAPALLEQHGAEIGSEYAARRREDASYRFRWPQRDGQRLDHVALAALKAMTDGHCSYCDANETLIGAVGEHQIDHFRPKSRLEFYELVCTWTNLFLTCGTCNKAKRDTWDELLLRPDDDDYRFERYFEFRPATGELMPNRAAALADQARTAMTITVFALNSGPRCQIRQRAIRELDRAIAAGDPVDAGYRFLIRVLPARVREVA